MAYTIRRNKTWLVAVFVLIATCGVLLGLQRIYAQDTPPQAQELPPPSSMDAGGGVTGVATDGGAGGTASGGASAASPTPPEPTLGLHQVVNSGVSVSSKKSWDGKVFSSLKFKYQTVDGRKLTVILPAEYKAEKKTKAGWETLFIVYAMDYEIAMDIAEKNRPPDVSAFMGQLMAEIRGQAGHRSAPEVISAAMDKANAYLPSIGAGNINMPIMLPGMP